jgi:hypothetical protein
MKENKELKKRNRYLEKELLTVLLDARKPVQKKKALKPLYRSPVFIKCEKNEEDHDDEVVVVEKTAENIVYEILEDSEEDVNEEEQQIEKYMRVTLHGKIYYITDLQYNDSYIYNKDNNGEYEEVGIFKHGKACFFQNSVKTEQPMVIEAAVEVEEEVEEVEEEEVVVEEEEEEVEEVEVEEEEVEEEEEEVVVEEEEEVEVEEEEEEEVEVEEEEVEVEEEEEVEVEEEEEVEAEEEEEVEVEEEEEVEVEESGEVYEVTIKGKTYYVTNETDSIIYDVDENGDVSLEVGIYKSGKPVFNKK